MQPGRMSSPGWAISCPGSWSSSSLASASSWSWQIGELSNFHIWVNNFIDWTGLVKLINQPTHRDSLGLAHWIFFMLLPSINYVIFPTVQTVTSHDLRRHVFGTFSSCCDRKEKSKEATVALEGQIEIEMKAMPLEPRPPIV